VYASEFTPYPGTIKPEINRACKVKSLKIPLVFFIADALVSECLVRSEFVPCLLSIYKKKSDEVRRAEYISGRSATFQSAVSRLSNPLDVENKVGFTPTSAPSD
jgi:hypothetical protein